MLLSEVFTLTLQRAFRTEVIALSRRRCNVSVNTSLSGAFDGALGVGRCECRALVSSVSQEAAVGRVARPHNKQLQRTVISQHVRAASASFHYALAARWIAQRAAAELRR